MRGQKRVEDARKRPSLQTEAGARITATWRRTNLRLARAVGHIGRPPNGVTFSPST
jgi:hypothetical protein